MRLLFRRASPLGAPFVVLTASRIVTASDRRIGG